MLFCERLLPSLHLVMLSIRSRELILVHIDLKTHLKIQTSCYCFRKVNSCCSCWIFIHHNLSENKQSLIILPSVIIRDVPYEESTNNVELPKWQYLDKKVETIKHDDADETFFFDGCWSHLQMKKISACHCMYNLKQWVIMGTYGNLGFKLFLHLT